MRELIPLRLPPPLEATKDISDYLLTFRGKLKEHNALARFALQGALLSVAGHWEKQ